MSANPSDGIAQPRSDMHHAEGFAYWVRATDPISVNQDDQSRMIDQLFYSLLRRKGDLR